MRSDEHALIGRAFGPALAALVLATAAVACGGGSGSPDEDRAEAETEAGGAAGNAFPVTIEHKFGSTTIEAAPERVVTVGLTDQDAVLALGVAPVGVTDWFGDHPHAVWPWAQDELGDLGNGGPEIVGDVDAIGFEQIAALQPDVILAVYAGLTEDDYDTLRQIAPTVAQPGDHVDWGVPWDEQTLIVGRALGRSAEAEAAVADVEARLDAARRQHPEFDGATGLVASPYADTISVYAPEDVRGRFLASLGFVQPPEIADLAGDGFSAELSHERTDLLDVDALIWIINSAETDIPRFDDEPLYAQLPVHRDRHDLFVENLDDLGGATSFVSVLSLPFLIDEMVPRLAAAVAGDAGATIPATASGPAT
jgi:iron complex transport system substrate-binding protein